MTWLSSSSSSSLSSIIASSNHEEHEVDVSLASRVEDALLAGIVSSDSPFPLDQRELEGDAGCGLMCMVGDLLECPSFFIRFSLARRFWNHTFNRWFNYYLKFCINFMINYLTCTTLISRPVSWLSCSLMCLAGLGELLYAIFNVSSCFAVIVVRGRFEEDSVHHNNWIKKLWNNILQTNIPLCLADS